MRALVVYAHPVESSYAAALRDRAVRALRTAGHDVDLLDLHAEGFDPVLSAQERWHHLDEPSTKPQLTEHFERLCRAELLVLVYPTWWGGQPAMLKGWFDRVWATGVAYDLPDGASRIRGRLRNVRRIVVVTTHGSSKRINALEGEPGKVTVQRQVRLLCHWRCRFRWVAMYGVDRSTDAERHAFLARVHRALSA